MEQKFQMNLKKTTHTLSVTPKPKIKKVSPSPQYPVYENKTLHEKMRFSNKDFFSNFIFCEVN